MTRVLPERLSLVLRDASTGSWMRFADPVRHIRAARADEVADALARADRALLAGRWVAGFVAYEAAPGFDPAIRVRDDGRFPLVALGVFEDPETVPSPAVPDPGSAPGIGRLAASVGEVRFDRAIYAVKDAIRAGDTYQVNYTYRLRGRLGIPPEDFFRHLVHAQAATYGAHVETEEWIIASASPELFFRRDGDRVVTRPMKGTAPRGRAGTADRRQVEHLLASRKERAENLMIVDMARNDLSRIARPGSVRVPELFVPEAYPTVWQLTSRVTAETDATLAATFRALFPAASITGAPKASTADLIARLECSPRRIYTGSIGFAAPDGRMQFNVAIRTALMERGTGRMEYGVGGGIVWDSDASRERKETRTKARILRRTTEDFGLLETLRWSPDQGFALFDDHVARLLSSARVFGFTVQREAIVAALTKAASRFPRRAMRVRLVVDRSGNPSVETHPLSRQRRYTRPRLAVAPAAIPSVDPFLRHKTTRREVYDRMLALCPGADDVLLWNERGELTESCFANVFLERDGMLWTPAEHAGLLPGTLRARLLVDGRATERVIRPDDLPGARVLLGNSVRGLYEPESIRDLRTAATREV